MWKNVFPIQSPLPGLSFNLRYRGATFPWQREAALIFPLLSLLILSSFFQTGDSDAEGRGGSHDYESCFKRIFFFSIIPPLPLPFRLRYREATFPLQREEAFSFCNFLFVLRFFFKKGSPTQEDGVVPTSTRALVKHVFPESKPFKQLPSRIHLPFKELVNEKRSPIRRPF